MAQNQKEGLDWWKKPEHLQEKKSTKTTTKGTRTPRSKRPKAPITVESMSKRLIKHGVIILILVVSLAAGSHFLLTLATRHGARRVVPQFESLSQRDAEKLAKSNDLNIVINDSLYAPLYAGGIVLDQLPEEGSIVKPGRTIYVTINATQKKMVPVPYVAGRSLRQAKNMLDIAGLTIEELVYEPDLATNYVLAQSYDDRPIKESTKTMAPMGSGITLYVGMEAEKVAIVPQLIGLTLKDAKSAIWESGLNVGEVKLESGIDLSNQNLARVVSQSIFAEDDSRLGSDISISLTLDQEMVDKRLKESIKERETRRKLRAAEADSLNMLEL
ncbi:MAG: PASTA domain-containing protein [Rikenellaceae bacterium]